MEQFLHAASCLEHCWHHRHTKQLSQFHIINMVATLFRLVKHIQRTHHVQVHIDELGGEIQIALQITSVNDVDNHVGGLLDNLLAHIQFFWRIGR